MGGSQSSWGTHGPQFPLHCWLPLVEQLGWLASLAGSAGGVQGLVSGMGVSMVSVVPGCAAPLTSASGVLWSGIAFSRTAQSLRAVKGFIACLNS